MLATELTEASGCKTCPSELATAVRRVTGSSRKVEHGAPPAVTSMERRLADTTGARGTLDFRTDLGLGRGRRDRAKWWHLGGVEDPPLLGATWAS